MRKLFFLTSLLLALCPPRAVAIEVLPSSHHQQFLTYGIFTEEQLIFAFEDAKKAWVGIGGAVTLLEISEWAWKTQVVAFANVTAGMRQDLSLIDFDTETVDTRFGVGFENHISPSLRFAVGYVHTSGHTCDGVLDKDLEAPNSGDDLLSVKGIYDYEDLFRFGLTLKPFLNSDPTMKFFAADQSVEWFPFHGGGDAVRAKPYLAVGLEEYGQQSIDASLDLQAGILVGNHFVPQHTQVMRLLVGAYSGFDPRLKYAQLKQAKVKRLYFGFAFNF